MALYQTFHQMVNLYPNNLCLADSKQRLNYLQVDAIIETACSIFRHHGIDKGTTVALYTEKTIDAAIVFLTLAKMGAHCVTLDSAFPQEMIEFVLHDSKTTHLVCLSPLQCKFDIPIIRDIYTPLNHPLNQQPPLDDSSAASWIVYSSGTTGKPKGISLNYQGLYHSIQARAEYSPYKPSDRIACNIYFYWEVFRPLLFGASAWVIEDQLLFDLTHYSLALYENGITETLWTPSFAEMLLNTLGAKQRSDLEGLQRLWLNGEVVSADLAKQLSEKLPTVTCLNLYSISETIDVSAKKIDKTHCNRGFSSIGRPFKGVDCLILNENNQRASSNDLGELCIGSPFLAQGYLNREQEEKKAFFNIDGTRYFRTKDLGFCDEEGKYYVLGRNDSVVKLRGYNVSLLAVENVLKKHLPIKNCIVKTQTKNAASANLLAFIEPIDDKQFLTEFTPKDNSSLDQCLKQKLSNYLPSYSIPSQFIINSENFRLNSYSLKLDRLNASKPSSEDQLKALWATVLQMDAAAISEDSDFYHLGANSLQVMQLIAKIQQQYSYTLDIASFDKNSQLQALRQLLKHRPCQSHAVEEEVAHDLNTMVYPMPLFTPSASSLLSSKAIFLTGATGFLGAHWLKHLLQQTQAKIYCLIRATSEAHALKRIQQALKSYHLNAQHLKQRVEIVTGNLSETMLGLSQDRWTKLSAKIDCILHAAANVNLFYSYSKLKTTTVFGTKELINFALTSKRKPFVLISSDAVLTEHETNLEQCLAQHSLAALSYGYAQSKWTQEKLIQGAGENAGLTYCILRLGNLGPSLKTKAVNPLDINRNLLQFVFKHRVVDESLTVEFTPVDKIVLHISDLLKNNWQNRIYTLSAQNVISAQQIISLLPGLKIKAVSHQAWLDLLKQHDPLLHALSKVACLFQTKAYHAWVHKLSNLTLEHKHQGLMLELFAKNTHFEEVNIDASLER